MKLKAEYDPEAKHLYLSIVDPPRDKEHYGTSLEKPMYGIFAVDLTREGDLQGYEFLNVDLEILKEGGSEIDINSSTEASGKREPRKFRGGTSGRSHSGDSRSR